MVVLERIGSPKRKEGMNMAAEAETGTENSRKVCSSVSCLTGHLQVAVVSSHRTPVWDQVHACCRRYQLWARHGEERFLVPVNDHSSQTLCALICSNMGNACTRVWCNITNVIWLKEDKYKNSQGRINLEISENSLIWFHALYICMEYVKLAPAVS